MKKQMEGDFEPLAASLNFSVKSIEESNHIFWDLSQLEGLTKQIGGSSSPSEKGIIDLDPLEKRSYSQAFLGENDGPRVLAAGPGGSDAAEKRFLAKN